MRKLLSTVTLGGVLSLALLGSPAHANIVSLGPGSPITSTITGIGTISFTPTPATEILQVTGTDYNSDFLPNNPSNVATGIATVFGVPTPTLTLDDEGPIADPYSKSVPLGFNYAAIHNDSGELIFFYSASESIFTLTGSYSALSNIRFYACPAGTPGCSSGPPLVPEPSALALVGSALLIFSFTWRRRRSF